MTKINLPEVQHILKVIRHPGCNNDYKYAISRAYIISKGLSAAGAWPSLRENEMRIVRAKIMKVFRSFMGDFGEKRGIAMRRFWRYTGYPAQKIW